MSITKKDIEHIARLARIEIADAEIAKYEKELSGVLQFVDKLAEIDTTDIEPLAGGTELINVMRGDDDQRQATRDMRHEIEEAAELVKAAPEHEEGWVKVKRVLEN